MITNAPAPVCCRNDKAREIPKTNRSVG